jgi:hypothetical protein
MAGKINLGSRTFDAKGFGRLQSADGGKKFYDFAVNFNSSTGAGVFNTPLSFFDALYLPNPCFLKSMKVNGTYLDTAGGRKKASQPLVEVYLFPFGNLSNLNNPVPQYTLNVNSTLDQSIYVSGVLGSMPIEYNGSLYIAPQSQLILSGTAYYDAATLGTDNIIVNVRLVFEY